MTPILKRALALLLALVGLAALAGVQSGTALAAGTTTDYVWSGYVRCSFAPNFLAYENVRWRIDYRHNSSGARDARAITYVQATGSEKVHIATAVQRWHGASYNIGRDGWYPGDVGSFLRYTAPAMQWTAIGGAADLDVALTRSDGSGCQVTHSY